jgi:peroxiredoxin
MKKIAFLTGLICILVACNQNKKGKGTLTGSLENIKDGTIIELYDLDSGKVFQNITVNKGKFKTDFILIKPRFFGIWGQNPKYDKDRLYVWLENSDIQLKGKFDYIINAKVKGSISNKIFEKYDSLEKDCNHKLTSISVTKGQTKDKLIRDSLALMNRQVLKQYKTELLKFFSDQRQTDVALYYLVWELTKYNSPLQRIDVEKLYSDLPEKFKLSNYGSFIKEYLSLPETPKAGERFIDCSQLTPDGKMESISNNLGKLTILEFWSSNCPPCRGEHPRVRKLYAKYHSKGLNIIGISGDDNHNDWKNAIQKDSIPWTNISDLKGFKNKAFLIYGVKLIPSMILLDKDGIIIDNNFNYWDAEIGKRLD